MDTVVFADKKYIKASKAALASGYTADYVGQLCRKGKIDAVLLGKTWYVQEDSLASHKQNNADRSNGEATRKDVRRQREELGSREEVSRINTVAESAHWRRLLETPISYSSESDDLIPSPIRTSDSSEVPTDEEDTQDSAVDELVNNDHQQSVESKNAEIQVPIRKEASSTSRIAKAHQGPVLQEIKHSVETEYKIPESSEGKEIIVRRSLAPMVLAASMFLFLLLNVLAEIRWTYTSGNGETSSLMEAEYNIASVSDIVSKIENK